ncbi:MAG: hypothetical protein K2L10_00145 [Ruminococcus sp.]|nr:hypothetical protein [Ruminococcus sp.]
MGFFTDLMGGPKDRGASRSRYDEKSCVECLYFKCQYEDSFGNFHNYGYCTKRNLKTDSSDSVCSQFVEDH